MATKTNEDLLNLVSSINNVLSFNGTENAPTTKSLKKLVKVYEKVKPLLEAYNESLENLRLDNASVDDKDNLVLNEKGDYKFSKEGLRKLLSQKKDLIAKEITFKVITVVNPQGLEEYTFLKDWVEGVEFEVEEEL